MRKNQLTERDCEHIPKSDNLGPRCRVLLDVLDPEPALLALNHTQGQYSAKPVRRPETDERYGAGRITVTIFSGDETSSGGPNLIVQGEQLSSNCPM